MSTAAQIPVEEGVFTWPSDHPQLIGSKCADCGVVLFPKGASCPRCTSQQMDEVLLPATGELYTFTIQGFRPKTPLHMGDDTAETFQPYGVGYIDLGEVKVESRLTESDPGKLEIGMPMRLVVVPFRTDDDGNERMTYAFTPAGSDR